MNDNTLAVDAHASAALLVPTPWSCELAGRIGDRAVFVWMHRVTGTQYVQAVPLRRGDVRPPDSVVLDTLSGGRT